MHVEKRAVLFFIRVRYEAYPPTFGKWQAAFSLFIRIETKVGFFAHPELLIYCSGARERWIRIVIPLFYNIFYTHWGPFVFIPFVVLNFSFRIGIATLFFFWFPSMFTIVRVAERLLLPTYNTHKAISILILWNSCTLSHLFRTILYYLFFYCSYLILPFTMVLSPWQRTHRLQFIFFQSLLEPVWWYWCLYMCCCMGRSVSVSAKDLMRFIVGIRISESVYARYYYIEVAVLR